MIRGNTVTQGYLHDEAATEAAFAGGVFHSGDIAVVYPAAGSRCATASRT